MAAGRTRAIAIKVPAGVYVLEQDVKLDHRFTGTIERRSK